MSKLGSEIYTEIYTDASIILGSEGNHKGGIGIYFGKNDIRNISKPVSYFGMTITTLETDAVYDALRAITNEKFVIIYSDSQHAVNCITIWYDRFELNGWRNTRNRPVSNWETIKKCKAIINEKTNLGIIIQLKHVAAHCGVPGNEAADRLAGLASNSILPASICNNVAISTLTGPLLINIREEVMPAKKKINQLPSAAFQSFGGFANASLEEDSEPESYKPLPPQSRPIPRVLPYFQKPSSIVSPDYSDSDKYWIKPIKAMDTEDTISQSDNGEAEIINSVEKEEITERLLFLVCMECTGTILVKYPSNHLLTGSGGINFDGSYVLAITKCRECITGNLKGDEYINISVEIEKHDKSLSSLRISDKIIMDSPCHHTANEIAGKDVPILTESRYIKYVPINIISKLCGKDTRSVSIDTTECIELPYLNNGFL